MRPRPPDLITQRFHRDRVLLVLPFLPLLPRRAATPTRHHQHAVPVARFVKRIILELALEAHGVEVHVAYVADVTLLPRRPILRRAPLQKIRRIPATKDQHVDAVDREETRAIAET